MSQLGNNGSGKTDWYGSFGSLLEKAFTGDVFEGLNVTAQGSPNMTVQVQPGSAKVSTGSTPSKQSYLVRLDTSGGVAATISTANASNPRRDLIVGYYKTSVVDTTNPNNPGALRFVVVAGTPAASPSDPNSTAIQSAITADGGSGSDPYIILARVTVAAAATQITSGNITDLRTLTSPIIQTLDPVKTETFFDFVASGLVWSGDSYGSTRNASMTAGVLYIAGKRLTIAAVSGRAFTASKDTYVDAKDNGDGTATLIYTEVANNAATPTSLSNGDTFTDGIHVRLAIIVTGASNILNVGSVNQGQEDKVLPIRSSTPMAVTDELGNLICPRDPNRKVLGMRRITSNYAATSSTDTQITGLIIPYKVPTGRKFKVTFYTSSLTAPINNTNTIKLWAGSVGGTLLQQYSQTNLNTTGAATFQGCTVAYVGSAISGSGSIFVSVAASGANSAVTASGSAPAYAVVELE